MIPPYPAFENLLVLPSSQAAPGHGVLPVNAYLLTGTAPVLVDTGLPADGSEFLEALWSLVDPGDLAAIFLTHEDADHAGNLLAVLDAAPQARLVTSYVTLGKLLERLPVPVDRVHVVNEGERVPVTDRRLRVLRPPVYDAPGTFGLHDLSTGAVLSVDAFGTYLPALVRDLNDVTDEVAYAGMVDFNRVNHPWISVVDRSRFAEVVATLAALRPSLVLSSHGVLPPGKTDFLLDAMAALPTMKPYVPPDQSEFEKLKPEITT